MLDNQPICRSQRSAAEPPALIEHFVLSVQERLPNDGRKADDSLVAGHRIWFSAEQARWLHGGDWRREHQQNESQDSKRLSRQERPIIRRELYDNA